MLTPKLQVLFGLLQSRTVVVDGTALKVPPGVLDPVAFRTGAWFARRVAAAVGPGERLLDLGCGSGVVGVLAARAGAVVTAVDVEVRAVAAARDNGIGDARRGDLFEAVRGERFDWICFNPPYFPGRGRGRLYGRALYGGPGLEVVRRFAGEVDAHLRPGGRAWVAWSERAPPAGSALGAGWERTCAERVGEEMLEIWMKVGA